MKAPQIIYICLMVMNVTINLVKHGEPKDGNYNIFTAMIGVAIEYGLLRWGGFFN